MKVAFNAQLLHSPEMRGWNRYTVNLLDALSRLGVEILLYTQHGVHPSFLSRISGGKVVRAPEMTYTQWEEIWVPRQLRRDCADIFHSPFNYGIPWFSPCPTVLTLHDAIDQVYYRTGGVRQRISKSALFHWIARTRASRVITVSEFSKTDLVEKLGIPNSRVSVVYEAADPRFSEPPSESALQGVTARYELGRPYFFYVGGWERRKNLPFLLKAFSRLRSLEVDLALAGGNPDEQRELRGIARELGVERRCRLLGRVPDAELAALYSGSIAFVYPSEYEGFGLQLCEAMSLGVPVLAAKATCLPEILGGGGEVFDLNDPSSLSALMGRVAEDTGFRGELQRRARARAQDFSWTRAAEQTLEIYRSLVLKSGS